MPANNKLFKLSKKDLTFTAIVSAIFIFAVHGFAFANLMYSHDSLVLLEKGMGRLKLGRWAGFYYIRYVRDAFVSPWMVGMVFTACLVASVLVVVELLNLTGLRAAAAAAIMSTSVALISLLATFINYADTYAWALLFACAAVLFHERLPKILNILVPIVLIGISMGFYQTYVSCAIVLFVLLLIKRLCASTIEMTKTIIRDALIDVGILAGGFVFYYAVMKLTLRLHGIDMSSAYNSPANLGSSGLSGMIAAIPQAYQIVIEYFLKRTGYNGWRMIGFNLVIIAVTAITAVSIIIRSIRENRALKEKGSIALRIILLVLFFAVLPLAANTVYIVSDGTLHQLMIYAFCFLYFVPLVLLEPSGKNKISLAIVCILMLLVGYHGFAYANGAYACKKLIYDSSLDCVQAIWRDVESVEGYEKGSSKIAVMGSFSAENLRYDGDLISEYRDLSGMTSFAVTYDGVFRHMLDEVMGKSPNNVRVNDENILSNPAYVAMPAYPQDGYVAVIDDTIVVKLSE